MKAPISVCYITKGEPHLAASIASVRPWVEEVCVLYTGPKPAATMAGNVDRFETMEWQDDFSAARNASFAMATRPYVMWLDSDDTLEGGENLAAAAKELFVKPSWAWVPYEYEHDASGNPTCVVQRPAIVTRGDFEWVFAVHEELRPRNEAATVGKGLPRGIKIVHHRTPTEARAATQRNIRILRRELEKNPNDTRSLFYLGCALFDAREFDASEQALSDLIRVPTTPDVQKSLACRRLSVIHELRSDLQKALLFAVASITENPCSESYFAVARVHRLAAEQGGPGAKREWEKVRHFTEVGLSLPETRGGLWVNPMERGFYAKEMLAHAYAKTGSVGHAAMLAGEALSVKDDDDLRGMVEAWRR